MNFRECGLINTENFNNQQHQHRNILAWKISFPLNPKGLMGSGIFFKHFFFPLNQSKWNKTLCEYCTYAYLAVPVFFNIYRFPSGCAYELQKNRCRWSEEALREFALPLQKGNLSWQNTVKTLLINWFTENKLTPFPLHIDMNIIVHWILIIWCVLSWLLPIK